MVYAELHRIARGLMRRERRDHTLQPTALVNEAYLKLAAGTGFDCANRAHFFGVAARTMRQILVDHARRHVARKRGGDLKKVTLSAASHKASYSNVEAVALDAIAIDKALEHLSRLDERMSKVVEMRIFGGLSMDEIAEALGVSRRTVYDDWDFARRWLRRELQTDHSNSLM